MDTRQIKARAIVETGKITREGKFFLVPSQSDKVRYRVALDGMFESCTCEDYELRGLACKHVTAVHLWLEEQKTATVTTTAVAHVPADAPKRKTYRQDWRAYNLAATTEKNWFMTLLADLCRDIPEPSRKNLRGRPVALSDGIFAAIFKVFSTVSARRFSCDLEEARERGHVSRSLHFNSVLRVFDDEAVTPILYELIKQSAFPLREVETDFAVDSSGFCTTRYERWTDIKYGTPRAEANWVKAHIACGTKTHIITAATILGRNTGDCNQLPDLVNATSERFTVEQVSADKGYLSRANYEAVDALGGTLYVPFKKGSTGGVGGLFAKAYHFFCLHRDEFLAKYHRRSNVESVFSMCKAKFGEMVRSKTDTAQKNEVLAKFVAHNLCCVVSAIYELGIDPTFLGLPTETQDDQPRFLRFPGPA